MEVDPELVMADPSLSLAEGVAIPWAGAHTSDYFGRLLESLADTMGFSLETPWQKLPAKVRRRCSTVSTSRSTCGTATATAASVPTTRFEGVLPYVKRRMPRPRPTADGTLRRFHARRAVPLCEGARLKPEISRSPGGGGASVALHRRGRRAADRGGGGVPGLPT